MEQLFEKTTKRVVKHMGGLFFYYRITYEEYFNTHFNKWCGREDLWHVYVRFDPSWFSYDEYYCNGFSGKSVTLFGVTFGRGYEWNDGVLDDQQRPGEEAGSKSK